MFDLRTVSLKDRLGILKGAYHKLPPLFKYCAVLIATSIAVIFTVMQGRLYSEIFSNTQNVLFILHGLMLSVTCFSTMTEKKELDDVWYRLELALRNKILYAAIVNLLFSIVVLMTPIAISIFSSRPAVVLAFSIAVILFVIGFLVTPAMRTTRKLVINGGISPIVQSLNYSTANLTDLKRLYAYQSARICMLAFIKEVPKATPISLLDKKTGEACVYSLIGQSMDVRDLEWALMFLTIGPAIETAVFGTPSTLSINDIREFDLLADRYFTLTKPGYVSTTTNEKDDLLKRATVSHFRSKMMAHCGKFLKANKSVVKEIFDLIKLDQYHTTTIEDLRPALEKLELTAMVPHELALTNLKQEGSQVDPARKPLLNDRHLRIVSTTK